MSAVVIHQNFAVSDIERMAHAFAKSRLFGVQNPEQALALCLVAQAEGRHPASAANDYHIMNGKPAKKAEAMLRDFISAGGKVEWHALSDTIADATFSHPGGGSARIEWTPDRAKKAGISSPMWSKYPRQMLRSRCVSEGVRTVCPAATSGMYVPEEVADFTPSPAPAPDPIDLQPEAPPKIENKGKATDLPEPRVARTKTELKSLLREFGRNLESACDSDTLETLIDAEMELLAQCRRDLPEWWLNDNTGGLSAMIANCRAQCEANDREREADRGEFTDPTQAG